MFRPPRANSSEYFQPTGTRGARGHDPVIEQLREALAIASVNLISAALVARMLGSESDANVFDEAARQARQVLLAPEELNQAGGGFGSQNAPSSITLTQRW
jgi:hypothetical protein